MRLVLAFLISLVFCDMPAAASQPVTLTIATDKYSYLQREPVNVAVALANTSGESLVINKRMAYPGPDLVIEITDPKGALLRWHPPAPPSPVISSDFVRLEPGQEFQVRLSDIARHLFDPFRLAGEYRVRAVYENREAGTQWHHAAWTGTVQSPAITIRWGG
jgi:hypothetical protein